MNETQPDLMNDGRGLVVDLFAGAGGWSEGAAAVGVRDVGVEWEPSACATRKAAGHMTIRADVAVLPTGPMRGRSWGLLGSPPCVSFSTAGKGEGRDALPVLCSAVSRVWDGAGPAAAAPGIDRVSALVLEPVRWARDLEPEWLALEQVPQALPVWQAVAMVLRDAGWSAWSGVLDSADYGVPQRRRRAILIASRVASRVGPPAPTHGRQDGDVLFGPPVLPWVTLQQTLGLPAGHGVYRRTSGGFELLDPDLPAPTVKPANPRGLTCGPRFDELIRLASTVPFLTPAQAKVVFGRPLASSRTTLAENAALQTFPSGYPWNGTGVQVYKQVGNAVPPLLAAYVIARAAGLPVLVPVIVGGHRRSVPFRRPDRVVRRTNLTVV